MGLAARLIGMQHYDDTSALLDMHGNGTDAPSFARYLAAMLTAGGDPAAVDDEEGEVLVRAQSWRMMEGRDSVTPLQFDIWNEIWAGALAVHNRHLKLSLVERMDRGEAHWTWRIEG